ncbi:MAG: aspartate aminotransferase family protein [Elusimicrobiota bacterium]|jgi:predicted acetylornithine/succinylornithine family transaminase
MDIQKLTDRYLFHTYKRNPLVIRRASGSWVWDDKGKKYLDFFSGLAVSGIGHAMPPVVQAIRKQAGTLIHCSNLFYSGPAARLAQTLCQRSFAKKVFLCNSGAEANEAAIKLARKFGYQTGGRFEIIVFENAFHGRTLGTLAATPQPKFQQGFGPLPPGFPVAEFNRIDSVQSLLSSKTVAILVEPVQGEGGIRPANPEFLKALRVLADQRNLLLIFDEVQVGLGRTGDLFAYQTFGVKPDILTLAKGLGGGMPIGAMLAHSRLASVFGPGDHGTTFGGNPVCSAAAFAVLKMITPRMLKNVKQQTARLSSELQSLIAGKPYVKELRGMGLMIGIELTVPGAPFVEAARQQGLLINCTQNNVLRFLPPLALSDSERRFALKVLKRVFDAGPRAG